MDDIDIPRPRDPAEAFDQMRAELSLLARAIQGLTAEREKLPDYSETLGEMDGRLRRISHNIVLIAEHPAMKLTPEHMGEEIAKAAEAARETDKATIARLRELHREAHADQITAIGTVRTRDQQYWQLIYSVIASALAVSLLWLFYPGWAASIGPRSWLWPEATARRALGEPTLWDAGIRLMRAGNPQGWKAIVDAAEMRRANRESIDSCEQSAANAKKPVQCTIKIGEPPAD